MPRAKKSKKEVVPHGQEEAKAKDVVLTPAVAEPVKPEPAPVKKEKPAPVFPQHIAESRKLLEVPLQAGQQLYETPEGEIILSEAGRGQVWARRMNGGKGGWANPRR